jgi:hypothetical protein
MKEDSMADFCVTCGQPLKVGAKFCGKCGQAAEGREQMPTTPARFPTPAYNSGLTAPPTFGWNWGAFLLPGIWLFAHRIRPNLAGSIPLGLAYLFSLLTLVLNLSYWKDATSFGDGFRYLQNAMIGAAWLLGVYLASCLFSLRAARTGSLTAFEKTGNGNSEGFLARQRRWAIAGGIVLVAHVVLVVFVAKTYNSPGPNPNWVYRKPGFGFGTASGLPIHKATFEGTLTVMGEARRVRIILLGREKINIHLDNKEIPGTSWVDNWNGNNIVFFSDDKVRWDHRAFSVSEDQKTLTETTGGGTLQFVKGDY